MTRSATPPADLLSARLFRTLSSVAMRFYSHLSDDERDQIAFCGPRGGRWRPLPGRSVGRKPRSPGSLSGTHFPRAGIRRFNINHQAAIRGEPSRAPIPRTLRGRRLLGGGDRHRSNLRVADAPDDMLGELSAHVASRPRAAQSSSRSRASHWPESCPQAGRAAEDLEPPRLGLHLSTPDNAVPEF